MDQGQPARRQGEELTGSGSGAPKAPGAPGTEVLEDTVVPAGHPWSGPLAAGECLRIVDLEGGQAVDFLCFGSAPHRGRVERYHAANTMKIPQRLTLTAGSVLYSQFARPMMTVLADTVPWPAGQGHDTVFGCCSFDVDRVRYGQTNPRCCQENFETEMARRDLGPEHVVANVNWFMAVPVGQDGSAGIAPSPSRPGDHVDLRAEMDVLCVLSNCPEALNPATGPNGPAPVRVVRWRP